MPNVLLGTGPAMLEHRPPRSHPESPERLARILRDWEKDARIATAKRLPAREASDAELLRVHTREHLERIARVAQAGGGQVEIDTWMSEGSERAARLAAGLALEAVDAVIEGRGSRAFCAIRPPGHHARAGFPMGFCLYSTAAVAAAHAIERHGITRVLVVDFDVHHGNGTQEIFYADPRVAFYSMHRYPFYPGTGAADETGTGPGLGYTCNLPVRYGTSRGEILAAFRATVESFADRSRPDLVIISAGFDAHARDPVGDLGLETEDFVELTHSVVELATAHCGGRVVSLLEGGYDLEALSECVGAHVLALGATRT